ncbi:3'(2'),5'-bisphosphate nucleotidase CysQ family protein [Methylomonas sp. MgM2]
MRLSADDLFLLSQCAISAAYQAGHIVAKQAQREVAVKTKSGGGSWAAQVVTEVDHLSQDCILQTLLPTCNQFDIAMLSEEIPDDRSRLRKDYFWCIDPLDGTLPFIEGVPGYSVSIALVAHDGTPMIGVVYDPLTQTLYHAIKDRGARRNGQVLETSSLRPSTSQTLTLITDKSFVQDPLYQKTLIGLGRMAIDLGYAGATILLQGGATMNACRVLEHSSACYVKFPKPHAGGGSVWDYAATSCLFREAAAPVSDIFGKPLLLNPVGSTFMNHCGVSYCTNQLIAERIIGLFQQVSGDHPNGKRGDTD